MKAITVIITMILFSAGVSAQSNKLQEVKIKTSSQCNDCKERIEEALAFEKGVKKSELDVKTQVVTVSYKKGKTSPEKIRKAISKVGYDADNVAADTKAYSKLPACCKKPDDPDYVAD
jgi:mercuric ion binding protein